MKRSNEKSYPVTFAFEQFLIDQNIAMQVQEEFLFFTAPSDKAAFAATTMHEMLGEYEHGAADLIYTASAGDKFGLGFMVDGKQALLIFMQTCEDILLTMIKS